MLRLWKMARSLLERMQLAGLRSVRGVEVHRTARIRSPLGVHIADGGRFRMGRGSVVERHSTVTVTGDLQIGRSVYIGPMATIGAAGTVLIEDSVAIGPGVVIVDSNKQRQSDGSPIFGGRPATQPIVIGTGTWVGANVVITAGVTLGEGCVIGAGSVVTSDVPARSTAVGVPARVIVRG